MNNYVKIQNYGGIQQVYESSLHHIENTMFTIVSKQTQEILNIVNNFIDIHKC